MCNAQIICSVLRYCCCWYKAKSTLCVLDSKVMDSKGYSVLALNIVIGEFKNFGVCGQ